MSDSEIPYSKIIPNIIFITYMKDHVNTLLLHDENRCYSDDPHVDVKAIADSLGIKIIYTSFTENPEIIAKEHRIKDVKNFITVYQASEYAFLIDDVNGIYIIFVNSRKSEEEIRFSIAHEIEHYISKKAIKQTNKYKSSFLFAQAITCLYLLSSFKINTSKINKQKQLDLLPNINDVVSLIECLPKKNDAIKKRSDYLSQLQTLEKKKRKINEVSKLIGVWYVSSCITNDIKLLFNKHISEKKTRAIFKRNFGLVNKKYPVNKALFDSVLEIIEEEIADYFAANLLVPTELFTLWEGKSNHKIARAFKVPVKCIKKRKKYEIGHELELITTEYLSFPREAIITVPETPNNMTHIIGGHRIIHDAGRG
jgi:Zn-dependent peptidase ImmA (M78 family)